MQVGERVQVQTKIFEGSATILYIAPGEIYPVQVEMDTPDDDGHKIQRISWLEIVLEPKENPVPVNVTFEGPDDPQQYLGEVIQETDGYRFKAGQKFILGVITFPGVYKARAVAASFYVYDPETRRFRGCMPGDMFKVLGPFTEVQMLMATQELEEPVPVAAEIIEEVQYRQMSLIDFL